MFDTFRAGGARPLGSTSAPTDTVRIRTRMVRMVAVVSTAAGLAGCAVGPDYLAPTLPLPMSWANVGSVTTAAPAALGEWWTRFDDPILDQLIDEAVAGNLDVRTAKARIREARARYREAVGGMWPSVDGSASATHGRNGSNVSSGGAVTVAQSYDDYQAGFDASWELDLFGANRRATEAAKYGLDAAEEDLRNTLVTLIGDVAESYVTLRGYQARLSLARRTARSQRATANLTKQRNTAGSASGLDVSQAEGLASSTEADIPALEVSYAELVHSLGVLTGQAPDALAKRLEKQRSIPAPPLPLPTGIPADVLLTRPDVRMAERQLAQYTAKIGEAEAALYPSVSLVGDIGTTGAKVGDLAEGSSISWSFGPSLTVPVFNAGELRAQVSAAKAVRDEYYLAYFSSVLNALEDVENATVTLAQEQIRRRRLAASARAYREAVNLSQALYKTGASSFLDVLDAERSLYSAEDALIQSRVTIATAYISLNKALGGGWNGTLDVSRPEVVDGYTGPRLAKSIVPPLPPEVPAWRSGSKPMVITPGK